ncbi:MAG: acyl-CoA dehydrogenase, partial [Gammaproteobacteria bacterium]|nr:acyl-CoA dehydrogenase [Gammaproteobacteria bacterium]
MNLDFGSEYDDFRDKVAGFCSSHKGVHLTGSLYGQYETIKRARSVSPNGETMSLIEWQQLLIENGYFARNIPKEYGGYGGELDIVKNVIINSEFNKAGIPSGTGGQGIDFLVPTLLEMGTEDQKKQYIKSALHLETIWCQGYSEPNAGSD